MKHYVYGYFDPRNQQIFYVGKGCGQRLYGHLKETEEKTDNIFKWRKINSICEDGLQPIIRKLHEHLSEEAAYTLEAALIKQYGRMGIDPDGVLTNRCEDLRPPSHKGRPKSEEQKQKMRDAYWTRVSQPGYVHPSKGKKLSDKEKEMCRQANLGRKHTNEHRRKNSESKKLLLQDPTRHSMYGKHHTDEAKQKMSEKMSGRTLTPEHIEKVRQTRIGSHHTEETKEQMSKVHSQKWLITDPEGNKFEIENLTKWCREKGFSQANLWAVADGRLSHAYGYKCQKLNT